jgi:predicted metal-dependent enzyme (double-stranded beta helix superfamily)
VNKFGDVINDGTSDTSTAPSSKAGAEIGTTPSSTTSGSALLDADHSRSAAGSTVGSNEGDDNDSAAPSINTLVYRASIGARLDSIKKWFEAVTVPKPAYEHLVEFSEAKYNRILVYEDQYLEVMLLAWLPGQATKVHDHPARGCLVRILEGEVQETIYTKHVGDEDEPETLRPIKCRSLRVGSVGYLEGERGIHRLENLSARPAVSMHIYSPPKHCCNIVEPNMTGVFQNIAVQNPASKLIAAK